MHRCIAILQPAIHAIASPPKYRDIMHDITSTVSRYYRRCIVTLYRDIKSRCIAYNIAIYKSKTVLRFIARISTIPGRSRSPWPYWSLLDLEHNSLDRTHAKIWTGWSRCVRCWLAVTNHAAESKDEGCRRRGHWRDYLRKTTGVFHVSSLETVRLCCND